MLDKSVDNFGNKFGDNLKSYPEFIPDYPLQKIGLRLSHRRPLSLRLSRNFMATTTAFTGAPKEVLYFKSAKASEADASGATNVQNKEQFCHIKS